MNTPKKTSTLLSSFAPFLLFESFSYSLPFLPTYSGSLLLFSRFFVSNGAFIVVYENDTQKCRFALCLFFFVFFWVGWLIVLTILPSIFFYSYDSYSIQTNFGLEWDQLPQNAEQQQLWRAVAKAAGVDISNSSSSSSPFHPSNKINRAGGNRDTPCRTDTANDD
jgi:hypothetical protein